jgi:hypothetical protein
MLYLTTLIVVQTKQRQNRERLMNYELEGIRKETVVSYLKTLYRLCQD